MGQKNICLIHGWDAKTEKLFFLKKNLEKLGWNVFLPKLPFFELKEPKKPWGLKEFSEFIQKDAKKFFKKREYIIFGHSFGGRVGIYMAKMPEVKGLVLCAAAGASKRSYFKVHFFTKISKAIKKTKIQNKLPHLYQLLRKITYRMLKASDYLNIDSPVKKKTFIKVISYNLDKKIKKIKKPVLILWGKKDRVTPIKDAIYLKENIKKSELIIFNQGKHNLPYKNPTKIAQKIDKWFKKYLSKV